MEAEGHGGGFTGDLSWLICKLQPGACSGLGGQAGSMASYMGR